MKTQKMIVTDYGIDRFSELVNEALSDGWAFVPTALGVAEGRYAIIVEKETIPPTPPHLNLSYQDALKDT